MRRLNAGEEAPPPPSYTVVSTRYDEVVTPYRRAGPADPGFRPHCSDAAPVTLPSMFPVRRPRLLDGRARVITFQPGGWVSASRTRRLR